MANFSSEEETVSALVEGFQIAASRKIQAD